MLKDEFSFNIFPSSFFGQRLPKLLCTYKLTDLDSALISISSRSSLDDKLEIKFKSGAEPYKIIESASTIKPQTDLFNPDHVNSYLRCHQKKVQSHLLLHNFKESGCSIKVVFKIILIIIVLPNIIYRVL